jgi:flagellar biosynthesis/type III secretory pathway protein FliH
MMIAHDFSTRLTQFERWRRRVYARGFAQGFAQGFAAAVICAAFFAYYLWVGMGKP